MKKALRLLSLAGIVAMMATSCYESDIENLQAQIDELKGGEIATLESQVAAINTTVTQLQTTQTQIQGYIKTLQQESETYKSQIAELQKVDTQLSDKINELKSYTDTEIKNARTWAEGTFATIDQMDSLCAVVAAIPAKIGEIETKLDSVKQQTTKDYKAAIEKAVGDVEVSLKAWVNEQLTGYYTIAQMDAILDSIKRAHDTADSTLLVKIVEQKIELDSAKVQITRAYKAAIKTACDSLKGVIDTKIATDIAAAKTNLQSQINSINSEITNIKNRLSNAEQDIAALINQIQSIAVIPTYSDGSVKVTGYKSDTLRFDVRPTRIAESLANEWKAANAETRAKMVSISLKGVMTKGHVEDVTIDSVLFQNDEFKVAATFANPDTNAVAALHIAYGKTDKSSEYFKFDYTLVVLIPGKFTVSSTGKQVQFTRGNLYWDGEEWGLEVNQTDYPTGSTWSTSHVGHFYWTKDAANSYAASYNESASAAITDKFFADGRDADHSLTIEGQSGLYALSKDEWAYLIDTRVVNGAAGEGKSYQRATVNSFYGLIIYPDDYTAQTSATTYTSSEWTTMESAGCVFLPAAGRRNDSSLNEAGSTDYYWSATPHSEKGNAYILYVEGSGVYSSVGSNRNSGYSVRLVKSTVSYPEAPALACVKIGDVTWAPVNCGYDATHTFGSLYQWGRKYGQAFELGNINPETLTKEQGEDPAKSGNFGKYDDDTYNWFSGDVDNTLWTENSKGTYDPCPEGWRVPTNDELTALKTKRSSWTTNTVGGVSQSGFWFSGSTDYSESVPRVFLSAAGCRLYENGNACDRGVYGYYWYSSVNGNYANYLGICNGNVSMGDNNRANGFSVRCVQE